MIIIITIYNNWMLLNSTQTGGGGRIHTVIQLFQLLKGKHKKKSRIKK